MKRALLAAALLALSASPSLAETRFDGFYVGAVAGHEATEIDVTAGGAKDEYAANGLTGGVFAGYGKAFGKTYVGAEGAYDYSGAEHNAAVGAFKSEVGYDHTFTVAARGGYLATPEVLVYGLTGWEHSRYSSQATGAATDTGWVNGVKVGAGAQYAVTDKMFLRGEYAHTFSETVTIGTAKVDTDRSVAKIGVGVRF